MSGFRRRLMMNAIDKSAECEYIESTGEQYIQTGIIPSNHTTTIEFSNTSIPLSGQTWWNIGCTNYQVSNTQSDRFSGGGNGSWNHYNIAPSDVNKHKVIYNDQENRILFDNVDQIDWRQLQPYGLAVFAYGTIAGGGVDFSKMRLYSLQIKDKTTNNLVRDFIPALDRRGKPALYDKISKTYFYNQGTGDFLYKIKE